MASGSQRPELVPFELLDVEGLEDNLEAKGCGSFGAVYEVSLYGLPCIAKSLHSILLGYESQARAPLKEGEKKDLRQKFADECILLSKLNHPNIVKFVGVYYGMYTGELSLIMEKLHTDLGNYVEKNQNIPNSIKMSLLLDASSGLLYLHSQEPPIIHRDLSAANVLVTTDGRAKIADVGVSTKYDTSAVIFRTQRQTVQPGAFAYMPPEAMCEHPEYDTKLDIFSFGAVMLYVINHKFPEVHEVSYSEMQEGKIQLAKRKTSVRSAKSHCLFEIASQCLEDNPHCRPTAVQLNAQLKEKKIQCPSIVGETEALAKKHDLELASLKEKCNAWQEEVERLAEFREEVQQLREENTRLTSDNEELTREILDENEKKQVETAHKLSEYDALMSRFVQLQQTRVTLEKELQPLREERAAILMENATLREGSQPQSYTKLKQEHKELKKYCDNLQAQLDEQSYLISAHQDSNAEKQQKLDLATDPERLQSIRERMERYKQERDTARKQVEELKVEQEKAKEQLSTSAGKSEQRLETAEQQVYQLQEDINHLSAKAAVYESRMKRYREERNKHTTAIKQLKERLATL